jgi:hypothetical protein
VNASTAILLFARTAPAEARAKRWGRGGARIARALIRRTEATVAASGLPVYRSSEHTQRGDTFGQRMAAAVTEVFRRGHDHLIVVGTDCPTLSAATLRRSTTALERGRPVIGADGRGGAYLIGLQREGFDAVTFASLRWQSPCLASQLRDYLPTALHLASERDYNCLTDLIRDGRRLRHLLPTLASFLLVLPPRVARRTVLASRRARSVRSLRGPPAGRRA